MLSVVRVARRLVKSIKGGLAAAEQPSWPQIEGLLALYRLLDGKEAIPPTRTWAMSPDILLILARLVRDEPISTVLECGCGVSTLIAAHMLRAKGVRGHITSLENDAPYAAKLRQEAARRGLEEFITILDAPLVEKRYPAIAGSFRWYNLAGLTLPTNIDLLVIDGPPGQTNRFARYPAGPELFRMLNANAKIVLDDTKRDDESNIPALWKDDFPHLAWRNLVAEKGAIELWLEHPQVYST